MVEFRHIVVRSARRVRLEFSSALAAGAFVPSWFTITCEDSETGNPEPLAAIAVPGLSSYLELALDRDLADAARYTLHIAAGVPAADASTVAATDQIFYAPAAQRAPSESLSADGLQKLIFQEDLAHDPATGHRLAPDNDLATETGAPVVKSNITRGALSKGLPHRKGWGANLYDDIDMPAPMLATTRGKLERQARRDDRVAGCRVTAEEGDDGVHYLVGEIELIGQVKTNLREPLNARK